MNIVIADDEHLVRLGLISMINEMETSWEVIGEATDGEELVDIVTRCQPEAAIVDIRMPGLDGIEAIERARDVAPRTKWIILTGYSDFQYAQRALKLGVSEYLLKPVNPADLEKAITHISKDNRHYLQLLNQQFENQLFSLFHGLVPLEAEPEDSLIRTGRFEGAVFYIDTCVSQNELEALQNSLLAELRQCIREHIVYGNHIALFTLPRGEIATVGVWDPGKPEARKQICSYLNHKEKIISLFRSDSTAITAIRTEETGGFMEFHEQIQHIQELSYYRVAEGMNREWHIGDIQAVSAGTGRSTCHAGEKLIQLAQEYKNNLYINYNHRLEELEPLLTKLAAGGMIFVRQYLHTVLQINPAIDSEESIPDLIRNLRNIGNKLLLRNQAEPSAFDSVGYVVAYIERNYMKNIGIGQIAGDLNITQSYLSTLFHRKTGTTFVKYLTRIRILKAKELLMQSNLQIQQVAEQVGYYSTRHFTKLFTEIVGVYPSDFKKSISSGS